MSCPVNMSQLLLIYKPFITRPYIFLSPLPPVTRPPTHWNENILKYSPFPKHTSCPFATLTAVLLKILFPKFSELFKVYLRNHLLWETFPDNVYVKMHFPLLCSIADCTYSYQGIYNVHFCLLVHHAHSEQLPNAGIGTLPLDPHI